VKTERNNYFLIDTNKLPFQLYSAFGDFSIKKNQIRLISLVDHLMNHVMFLAPLDISARELTWDVLQPFESIFQLFHLLLKLLLALLHGILQYCFASFLQPWPTLFRYCLGYLFAGFFRPQLKPVLQTLYQLCYHLFT